MIFPRNAAEQAKKHIKEDKILLFIGARQAGKTTILKQLEQYEKEQKILTFFLNLEDPEYLGLLNQNPKNLFRIFPINLATKTCIFIDEIQYLKNPTNLLKYFYDEYKGKIKIIATGSSAFYLDKKFQDSLVGRKKLYPVFTLSFREFLQFKKQADLASKSFLSLSLSEKEIVQKYFSEYMIFGGYPRVVLASSTEEKIEVLRDIAYSYIKRDILDANVKKEDLFYKLFRILSSQIGGLLNTSELANTLDVSRTALEYYLSVMRKSFHIEFIKPFFRNVRKELTKMPKVYFMDLGLKNFFVDNFKNLETREDAGQLLENAVFRQLINTHDPLLINFWRTQQKQEVDFILSSEKAFEVKINLKQCKAKKYKIFSANYPNIPLTLVTLHRNTDIYEGQKVFDAWELS